MDCPHCGSAVVCAACGTSVEESMRALHALDALAKDRRADAAPDGETTFLIVARGHGELLDQLKEVVGTLGWVRLVEDRRQDDETILPREGREGSIHVEPTRES